MPLSLSSDCSVLADLPADALLLNHTSSSSDYSLSNRSSLPDVSNMTNTLNTNMIINNNLWNNTSNNNHSSSNESLSNLTFTNWNSRFLNSNSADVDVDVIDDDVLVNGINNSNNATIGNNTNIRANPDLSFQNILSLPVSPIQHTLKSNNNHLTNNRSYQFSLHDPFLPASLLPNSTNNNNNLLSNQSLINNQFLNPNSKIPLNSNPNPNPNANSNSNANSIYLHHNTNTTLTNPTSLTSSSCSSLNDHFLSHQNDHINNKINNKVSINNSATIANNKTNKILFKTELCDTFQKNGFCPYNDKCQFAHGFDELKSISRNRKWKTKMCKNWLESGYCRYGKRCCYKHGENDNGSSAVFQESPSIMLNH